MIENGIIAPKLISNHIKHGIMEISDLGQKSFYEFIFKKKNKFYHYKNLVKLIIKLQNIKLKKNYYLGKKKVKFQIYTANNLHKESDLFFDWYLKNCLKSSKIYTIKKIFRKN